MKFTNNQHFLELFSQTDARMLSQTDVELKNFVYPISGNLTRKLRPGRNYIHFYVICSYAIW